MKAEEIDEANHAYLCFEMPIICYSVSANKFEPANVANNKSITKKRKPPKSSA